MNSPSPFIVAEMSANHLGSYSRAAEIVHAAAEAGADGIKLQTWKPDTMCVDPYYVLDSGPWKGRRLMDLYREAHTPWEWHAGLFRLARQLGLTPFSAAFDMESVDFLETLGVDRHKVASFELTDLPLIAYMASKGKPMILSTGMATFQEVNNAYDAAMGCGAAITVLRCISAYPAEPKEFGLAHGGGRWGLSDHTPGVGVSVAAVALGARYVEKHLTLSRADGGPDAGFSMEPVEFKQLATECRRAAAAMAPRTKDGPTAGESPHLRRSLWAVRNIAKGEPLIFGTNIRTARPALGLPPSTDLSGRTASRDIEAGTPLTQECVA